MFDETERNRKYVSDKAIRRFGPFISFCLNAQFHIAIKIIHKKQGCQNISETSPFPKLPLEKIK